MQRYFGKMYQMQMMIIMLLDLKVVILTISGIYTYRLVNTCKYVMFFFWA